MAQLSSLESLQFAFFFAEPFKKSVEDLCKDAFAEVPSLIERRPAEGLERATIDRKTENSELLKVVMSLTPLRLDILIAPTRSGTQFDANGSIFLGTEDFPGVYDELRVIVDLVMPLLGSLQRIGVVARTTDAVPDRGEAVKRLLSEVPFRMEMPLDADDVIFQYNIRKPLASVGFVVNVVRKWQVVSFQHVEFSAQGLNKFEGNALQRMFDINTAAEDENKSFDESVIRDVILEVVAMSEGMSS